jgi:hypothetical protein
MLLSVIIVLLVIGVVLWLLRDKIDPTIRTIIIVLLVLAVALWILDAFNLITLPSAFRLKGAR